MFDRNLHSCHDYIAIVLELPGQYNTPDKTVSAKIMANFTKADNINCTHVHANGNDL